MGQTNIVMPQMGESITEGTLTKWNKKIGDKIEREEILFEISTDKVDSEIPSPKAGYLAEILVKEGTVVPVNTVVAIMSDDPVAAGSGGVPATAPAPAAQSNSAPQTAAAPAAASTPTAPAAAPVTLSADGKKHLTSPLVRKMAAEHNVDVTTLKGTGESGRVTKNDLLAALSGSQAPALMKAAAASISAPISNAGAASLEVVGGALLGNIDGVRVERVPMSSMRKKIADHMVMSKHTSPHVTSVIEVDVQKIVDLRAKIKDKFEAAHGFKLSFMPFFLRAALEGVKAVPAVNASVDGDAILYKKDINLGVAVALDWGLIVPVIKNCAERNFIGLGRELNNLAERARTKKLAPDDVKGGTFSISNYGGFGTLIGQPIINQPQVAIMGLGALVKRPVVINDAIAIRTMCYVVLTFDHRILDGADSGKFLSTVKNHLENWNETVL